MKWYTVKVVSGKEKKIKEDIENELKHYKKQFRGKVVFCNCDDPKESNFVKYFSVNFEYLGLKKLIATHYKEANLFTHESPYKLEYTGDKKRVDHGRSKKSAGSTVEFPLHPELFLWRLNLFYCRDPRSKERPRPGHGQGGH